MTTPLIHYATPLQAMTTPLIHYATPLQAMTTPLIDYNTNGHTDGHQENQTPDTRTMDYSTIDTATKFLVPMLQQTADENNMANNVANMQYAQSPGLCNVVAMLRHTKQLSNYVTCL